MFFFLFIVASVGAFFSPGENAVRGLVGYFPFSEGTGTYTFNKATHFGTILGKNANGHFKATNESDKIFTFGHNGGFGLRSEMEQDENCMNDRFEIEEEITLMAWVKVSAFHSSSFYAINKEQAYRLNLVYHNRKVDFLLNLNGLWGYTRLYSNTKLNYGEWTHIAGTYDGKSMKVYINGVLDSIRYIEGTISNRYSRTFNLNWNVEGNVYASDEVKIFSRALNQTEIQVSMNQKEKEIEDIFKKNHLLNLLFYKVKTIDFLENKFFTFKYQIFNAFDQPFQNYLTFKFIGTKSNQTAHKETKLLHFKSYSDLELTFQFPKCEDEEIIFLAYHDSETEPLFSSKIKIFKPYPRNKEKELKLKLMEKIDFTVDLGEEKVWEQPNTHVIEGDLKYRECSSDRYSRFAVLLNQSNYDHSGYYMFRLYYPDDKKRMCEVTLHSSIRSLQIQQIQTGFSTGYEFELSNQTQYADYLYYHDLDLPIDIEDLQLIFFSWKEDFPCAFERLESYQIMNSRLPSFQFEHNNEGRREVGLFWEDIQTIFNGLGGTETYQFDEMIKKLVDYMDYCGMNSIYHPMVWYSGPTYHSLVDYFTSDFPNYWVDLLLYRFKERGFKFIPTLNVHTLHSLVAMMETNPEILVLTNEDKKPPFSSSRLTFHHSPPAFNSIHPIVQEKIKNIVTEITNRYSYMESFKGISFHLTQCSLLWNSDLKVSYDIWTVNQFQNDNQIPNFPTNISEMNGIERFNWIMENCREKWIDWKIKKNLDFFTEISKFLVNSRNDLKLILILHSPSPRNNYQDWISPNNKSIIEIARETGIDPNLLKTVPEIQVMKYLGHTDFRETIRRYNSAVDIADFLPIREMDFDENIKQFKSYDSTTSALLFSRYFEISGRETDKKGSDWLRPINWRASAVVPSHYNFLEAYINALSMYPNLNEIVVGGFTLGSVGHEKEIRHFSSVFSYLPINDKWERIMNNTIPSEIIARKTSEGFSEYIYFINTSPRNVSFSFYYSNHAFLELFGDSTIEKIEGKMVFVTISPFGIFGGIDTSRNFYANFFAISLSAMVGVILLFFIIIAFTFILMFAFAKKETKENEKETNLRNIIS